MAISPVTNTSSGSASAAPVVSNSANTISTTDFMRLLSAEMANQDPMQPMDPTQTMTQLAQFTTLQQTSQLSQNQSLATANSYLGAQVTFPGTNGNPAVTGIVSAIDASQVASGGAPQLILQGNPQEYPLTSISQVTLPPPAATTTSPASSPATSGAANSNGSTGTTTTTPAATPSSSGG